MNRKNVGKVMGLGLMVALLTTGVAWARGPGTGGPCGLGPGAGQGAGFGQGLARLGLDQAQQKQLDDLRTATEAKTSPVREKLKALRAEMHALWQAERPDRNAILAKQDEMEKQRVLLREARVDLRLEIQKLLTPEQRKQAAELQKDRPGRGKFGRGKHGRGGHPGCPYAAGAGN